MCARNLFGDGRARKADVIKFAPWHQGNFEPASAAFKWMRQVSAVAFLLVTWSSQLRSNEPATLNIESPASAVAVSPDGTVVAVATSAGDLCFWSVEKQAPVITVRQGPEHCFQLGFSGNGAYLGALLKGKAGKPSVVRVWKKTETSWAVAADLLPVDWKEPHWIADFAFSPDGKAVMGTTGTTANCWLHYWETETGKTLALGGLPGVSVAGVAWSGANDIKAVAVLDDDMKGLLLYDMHEGESRERRISASPGAVEWSRDGNALVAMGNELQADRSWAGHLTVVNFGEVAETAERVRANEKLPEVASAPAFSSDGEYLAYSTASAGVDVLTIKTMRISTGVISDKGIHTVAFGMGDRKLITCDKDGKVKVWSIALN